jgi:hypothetical protein
VPHEPQLVVSLEVSTQCEPHRVLGAGHATSAPPSLLDIAAHVPRTHAVPSGHTLSQSPQLSGSVCVSVQPEISQ